ncbi:MAG: HRDC domain-containing protein [Candidatus Altiarchaeota archaeon]|nr:HRDC domain-containing protein [Candidatus Altiarchaeota archaeon]
MHEYTYIDSMEALEEAACEWKKEEKLGIDLECENNLHCYGTFISLIQVSSRKKNWVLDVLRMKDIKPALEMLEDPGIEKIFHDSSFDLRILAREFGCRPRNIFDTQIAALFLGKVKIGLDHLIAEFLTVSCEANFQKADWTRRPLPEDMLSYAVCDTHYLPKLRDILCRELERKGRLAWVLEELALLEEKEVTYTEPTYINLKGVKSLTGRERSVLKALFNLRERMAKKANKPPYYIIGNRRLMELVKDHPRSLEGWSNVRGTHPIVRRNARLFLEDVKEAAKKEITIPHKKRLHYTPKQNEHLCALGELRDKVSEESGLPKHLVLCREQMQDIALTGSLDSLKRWQKEFLGERITSTRPRS